MKPNAIIVDEKDNVAIALTDIAKGGTAVLKEGRTLVTKTDIPFSHKILLEDLSEGEEIIKYGEVIGKASTQLMQGEWIHSHNMESIGD
ncbi:MAG: UxaA family hydrolase [Deltaproteobacteria bacterium]|nr:UxaA family hydrolase [Deltaproteobacteria bacterium]